MFSSTSSADGCAIKLRGVLNPITPAAAVAAVAAVLEQKSLLDSLPMALSVSRLSFSRFNLMLSLRGLGRLISPVGLAKLDFRLKPLRRTPGRIRKYVEKCRTKLRPLEIERAHKENCNDKPRKSDARPPG
jgi:hypothetical protein